VHHSFDNHPWTDRTLAGKRSDGGIATDWENSRRGHSGSDSGFEFRTDLRINVRSEHDAESDYNTRRDADSWNCTAWYCRAHAGDGSTNSGNSGTDARNR
jgi:hypothetical protein